MHFIMGTQRGIIWVETLRMFMLRRTATVVLPIQLGLVLTRFVPARC